jgi:hypothetical protein
MAKCFVMEFDMRQIHVAIIFCCALCFSPMVTPSLGQNSSQLDRGRNLRSPEISSVLNTSQSLALARFSANDKTAEARVALLSTTSANGEESLVFSAGGPVSKSTGSSFLVDETGLRSSTTAGLHYTKAFFAPGDNVDPRTLSAICERYTKSRNCNRQQLPTSGKQEFDAASSFKPPIVLGLSAQIGRDDFDYLDLLQPQNEQKTASKKGYSLAAGAGRGFDELHTFLSISYRSSKSFKASDEVEVCQPHGAAGALTCSDAAIAPPKERRLSLLALESRSFFASFAVAPKIGYDFKVKKWRADVPLYLFRNDQGGFIGGLSTAWQEGERHLAFAAFIGRTLGLQLW